MDKFEKLESTKRKNWSSYKERAIMNSVKYQVKGLPCLVGDTIYYITRSYLTRQPEIVEGQVSMVLQNSSKEWQFRFSYKQQQYKGATDIIIWDTHQDRFVLADIGNTIFTTRHDAELQLNYLLEEH